MKDLYTRRWLKVFLRCLLVLSVGFAPVAPASQPLQAGLPRAAAAEVDKTGSAVLLKLEKDIPARVVIALENPAAAGGASSAEGLAKLPLAELNRQVASLQTDVLAWLQPGDFQPVHQYRSVPALVGVVSDLAGLQRLASHPLVRRIDLDVGGSGSLANSVPYIGANTWHNIGVRGDGVAVAVLDSGIDTDHPDLAPALIHQACFLDDDGWINGWGLCPNGSDRQYGAGAAEDDLGHGSHVSGIVASRGVVSSRGVAPGASIVAIKVLAGASHNGAFYFFSEIVAALDYLINNPQLNVKVVNMSLGTSRLFSDDCDNLYAWTLAGAAAVNALRAQGVIAFASSGNEGSTSQMSAPACLSSVVAVGAANNNNLALFSNRNRYTDLLAPGVGILSDYNNGGLAWMSGTSMASPHAAGCAALLIKSKQATTPSKIEALLKASPVHITDPATGSTYPRLECRLVPIASLALAAPTVGFPGAPVSFSVSAQPVNATTPITYTWRASGLSPITHVGGSSDSAAFTWNVTGVQYITVTAQSYGGARTASAPLLVKEATFRLYLALLRR